MDTKIILHCKQIPSYNITVVGSNVELVSKLLKDIPHTILDEVHV